MTLGSRNLYRHLLAAGFETDSNTQLSEPSHPPARASRPTFLRPSFFLSPSRPSSPAFPLLLVTSSLASSLLHFILSYISFFLSIPSCIFILSFFPSSLPFIYYIFFSLLPSSFLSSLVTSSSLSSSLLQFFPSLLSLSLLPLPLP